MEVGQAVSASGPTTFLQKILASPELKKHLGQWSLIFGRRGSCVRQGETGYRFFWKGIGGIVDSHVFWFYGKDFSSQHRTDFCFAVPGSQLVIHTGYILPAGSFKADCFPAPRYLAAHLGKQLQKCVKVCWLLLQRPVNHHP